MSTPVSPAVTQFAQQASALAARLGLQHLVILVRDPKTGEGLIYSSPGAKETLRETAAEKFGFADPDSFEAETAWPG